MKNRKNISKINFGNKPKYIIILWKKSTKIIHKGKHKQEKAFARFPFQREQQLGVMWSIMMVILYFASCHKRMK